MNTMQENLPMREVLWQKMVQEHLVEGDIPPRSELDKPLKQAWYLRVMLGFAGWLGALFLMGFVFLGLASIIDHALVSIVIGLGLCGAAYALFHFHADKDFITQFALALSLAGQGFVVVGLFREFGGERPGLFVVLVMFEIALIAVINNWIHRFLSTLGAVYAAYLLFQQYGFFGLIHGCLAIAVCYVWWMPQLWRKPEIWRPVAFALALGLIGAESSRFLASYLFDTHYGWWLNYGWRLGSSMASIATIACTVLILRRQNMSLTSVRAMLALAGVTLIGGFSYVAPGLCSALLLILIAYHFMDRLLLGLGLFAMLSFFSHYYYQLQVSLLYKSIVLASLALLLFGMRMVLNKLFPVALATSKELNSYV